MKIKKIQEDLFEIEKTGEMNVPVRIFANENLLENMKADLTLQQAIDVSKLPNIKKYSFVCPDAHQGYGFCIGGVAAFDFDNGIITPGGIGFDINCGVRLITSNLKYDKVKEKINELLPLLLNECPAGLGSSNINVTNEELNKILDFGAEYALEKGFGDITDLNHCEENGRMKEADHNLVSDKAKKRGRKQIATLGSGNHFLEIQYIDEIYDEKIAKRFGLKKGNITFMIHCGSRGLGHQVCSDYLREMEKTYPEILEKIPNRQLIYAPSNSTLGKNYFKAMSAAANFAWYNRHMLGYQVKKVIKTIFPNSELTTVYDVAHNICKIEEHIIDGKKEKLYVHRKGATRAFGPGRIEIPELYRDIGQPVLIPGSMGTSSYVLIGTNDGMKISFGSTAHGAGRSMSRHEALKQFNSNEIIHSLKDKGIKILGTSKKGIAEEAPEAYKDVDEVIKVSDKLKIGKKVAKLKPIGVIKG